jgi:hypothetical protein
MEEKTNVRTNEVDLHLRNDRITPMVDPEQFIKAESGYCPRYTKHSATGDRWKTCKQSRVFLCEVTVELVVQPAPMGQGMRLWTVRRSDCKQRLLFFLSVVCNPFSGFL